MMNHKIFFSMLTLMFFVVHGGGNAESSLSVVQELENTASQWVTWAATSVSNRDKAFIDHVNTLLDTHDMEAAAALVASAMMGTSQPLIDHPFFVALVLMNDPRFSGAFVDGQYYMDVQSLAEKSLKIADPELAFKLARVYRLIMFVRSPSCASFVPRGLVDGKNTEALRIIIPGLIEYGDNYITTLKVIDLGEFDAFVTIPSESTQCWAGVVECLTQESSLAVLTQQDIYKLVEQAKACNDYLQRVLPAQITSSFQRFKDKADKEWENLDDEDRESFKGTRIFCANPRLTTVLQSFQPQANFFALLNVFGHLRMAIDALCTRAVLSQKAAASLVGELEEMKKSIRTYIAEKGVELRQIMATLDEFRDKSGPLLQVMQELEDKTK